MTDHFSSPAVFDERREILGTHIRITAVVDDGSPDFTKIGQALEDAFAECSRLDQSYSRFRTGNELSQLNGKLQEWQEVNSELFLLLREGKEIGEKTAGAFNLAVKNLLESWGYDPKYSFEAREESATISALPYELEEPNQVKLLLPVELGGLGKGYALDLMAEKLSGFKNICIDAGGDLYAKGKNEKGEPWKILFEHPLDVELAIGEVEVDGFFLAASNPLKRSWKNYHHLVDPHRRLPANQMLAVYTQAQRGLLADAYSTALFALGFERARELLPSLPVEAMLISPEGKIHRSPHFQGKFF